MHVGVSSRKTTPIRHNKIQSIIRSGYKPEIMILFDNISEKEAYQIEKDLISLLGTLKDETGKLTNILKGGWNRKYDSEDNLTTYEKIKKK